MGSSLVPAFEKTILSSLDICGDSLLIRVNVEKQHHFLPFTSTRIVGLQSLRRFWKETSSTRIQGS